MPPHTPSQTSILHLASHSRLSPAFSYRMHIPKHHPSTQSASPHHLYISSSSQLEAAHRFSVHVSYTLHANTAPAYNCFTCRLEAHRGRIATLTYPFSSSRQSPQYALRFPTSPPNLQQLTAESRSPLLSTSPMHGTRKDCAASHKTSSHATPRHSPADTHTRSRATLETSPHRSPYAPSNTTAHIPTCLRPHTHKHNTSEPRALQIIRQTSSPISLSPSPFYF